jgi:glycosyltransferase involved in cell wall biosynthesis
MRILHVVPTYLPAVRYGGPIFAVHGLCRALVARGHEVEVFTTNVDGPENSAVPLEISVPIDGVHVRYFLSRFLRRLYWSPSLTHALRREVKGFDVVHLHSVFLWPTSAAARSARNNQVPYLISPRGMLVKELIRRRSRWAKTVWIKLFERRNLEGASAIHVTSELEAVELMRFNWRLPRVITIANGVDDPERAAPGTRISADIIELAGTQPLVLFLGRLSWKKGLDRLLKAFALTNRGNLAIVGTDDEDLVPQLSQLSQSLKIGNRVRFLPRTVSGCDKEHLFAAAQLFVLSSYSENLGNTVLEAMRRGVPVVVTPEVGAAQIVRESGGGLVVAGDPEPLSGAISRLTEDTVLARAMGEAGRHHVVEHYTWSSVATEMEALYESIRA